MKPNFSPGPDASTASDSSVDYSDMYCPSCSVALRLQQSHRLQPRSLASVGPLVATWATNFNTDPSCSRTMDPDMVLNISLGPIVTMATDSDKGYPDQHGSRGSIAPGHKHGPWRQTIGISMALDGRGAMDISTDPCCCRTRDPDTAIGSSLAQTSP